MTTPLPTVSIQSTGAAQTAVPFTFGQVFAPGHLLPTDGLLAGAVQLQVDVKATHADGSVRHAVLSGVMPRLGAGETVKLQLAKTILPKPVASVAPADLTAAVEILLGGVAYTATLAESDWQFAWLEGPIVSEAVFTAPLRAAAGDKHPRLSVRFGVRRYLGAKRARVEFVIENTKTFSAGSNETYDVALMLNDKVVYERKALTHYHHARWRATAWVGVEPALIVHPDTAYVIASKVVPNYDRTIQPAESAIAGLRAQLTPNNTGPMTVGPLANDMGMSGGRPELGLLPQWAVFYLLSADARARDVMMATAEGSGTWCIHYRDENTGYPVRTDSSANRYISTHMNLNHEGPLPVPRAEGGNWDRVASPFGADTAHEPSLVYLPYLVTGEYYYLEELHFWATWNPLGTAPGNSGDGAGLLRWQQVRGQAWSLRTLGHAASITPDNHPMKAYFVKQMDNNLDYYQDAFVSKNPNPFGVYDGTPNGAFRLTEKASAPWQDDFLTSSFGHLVELGFEKARPILQWKAKYVTGRMAAPGYCWIHAAPYFLFLADGGAWDKPMYGSFAELYAKNFYDGNIKADGDKIVAHPRGIKWADVQCGTQAQADWLTEATGTTWLKGQMWGYSASTQGYPANMQPALAMAADSGIPGAAEAWATFDGRTAKPDYGYGPQFAIVPRTVPSVAYVPSLPEPSSPIPPPATTMTVVDAPTGGTWQDAGVEGAKVDVPKDTIVRYGAGDKFVVAKVGGAFVASNAFFGRDPVFNVVKKVQKFSAGKPGKITTPSSTKLVKKTKLSVSLFDPKTLSLVKKFDSVTANSKGTIMLSDAAISVGAQYASAVSDAAGNVVLIQFPLLGS